jgi:predicted O-methyltransferase YrrM
MLSGVCFWESAAPGELFEAVSANQNRHFVRTVVSTLTTDPAWTNVILQEIAAGRIELRCFLSWLACELKPKTYMEVGVRRGLSMAVVAARCPEVEIYGFDTWIPGYGGVENPGPQFVQSQMAKVGYKKRVHFVTGDSHKTLPAFFRVQNSPLLERGKLAWRLPARPRTFDMITIDGDHSLIGAYEDLMDTMPYCSPGGVVVFDDIAADPSRAKPGALEAERGEDPHGWGDLLGVWRAVQRKFTDFRYFEYVRNPPGVGLAVRLR